MRACRPGAAAAPTPAAAPPPPPPQGPRPAPRHVFGVCYTRCLPPHATTRLTPRGARANKRDPGRARPGGRDRRVIRGLSAAGCRPLAWRGDRGPPPGLLARAGARARKARPPCALPRTQGAAGGLQRPAAMAGYPPGGMAWGVLGQGHPAVQQLAPRAQQALPIEALGLGMGSRIEVSGGARAGAAAGAAPARPDGGAGGRRRRPRAAGGGGRGRRAAAAAAGGGGGGAAGALRQGADPAPRRPRRFAGTSSPTKGRARRTPRWAARGGGGGAAGAQAQTIALRRRSLPAACVRSQLAPPPASALPSAPRASGGARASCAWPTPTRASSAPAT
jgi:hypothetical protein